jgi:hypothetical protein
MLSINSFSPKRKITKRGQCDDDPLNPFSDDDDDEDGEQDCTHGPERVYPNRWSVTADEKLAKRRPTLKAINVSSVRKGKK